MFDGFTRSADEFADLLMGEREAEAGAEFGCVAALAEIEQKAGQLFRRR